MYFRHDSRLLVWCCFEKNNKKQFSGTASPGQTHDIHNTHTHTHKLPQAKTQAEALTVGQLADNVDLLIKYLCFVATCPPEYLCSFTAFRYRMLFGSMDCLQCTRCCVKRRVYPLLTWVKVPQGFSVAVSATVQSYGYVMKQDVLAFISLV